MDLAQDLGFVYYQASDRRLKNTGLLYCLHIASKFQMQENEEKELEMPQISWMNTPDPASQSVPSDPTATASHNQTRNLSSTK